MKYFMILALTLPLSYGAVKPCKNAAMLENSTLPHDIAVKIDGRLRNNAVPALDFWAARMGFTWHEVKTDCEIYIQYALPTTLLHGDTLGQTQLPTLHHSTGVALISKNNEWIIAHEIGHLLGFTHSVSGLMMAAKPEKPELVVSDFDVTYSASIRGREVK